MTARKTLTALAALLIGISFSGLLKAETLRVGWPATAVSAAYPFARDDGGGIRMAFYDALTWLDINGVLNPRLAVSWENEDDTTWIFQLREGVTFSNGEPFNAQTAVAVLDIFLDPAANHPRTADVSDIASYRARGPYELEIITTEPDPVFPRRMGLVPMIEPKAWAEMGQEQYSREPVGTGPYKIVSWGGNNTRPILEHVPTSWRPIGNIKRVEMRVITDPGARISGMLSGQLDFIMGVPPDDIMMLEASGISLRKLNSPNVLSISFRTVRDDESPLSDARVRRAINHAVDKEAIAQLILGGNNQAMHQPAIPGLIGYNPDLEPFDYNPEKAQAMLAEAGFENGFDLKFSVYSGLLPGDTLIFQKVAQDLGAVGVNTELRQISFPDYVRRIFSGEWGDTDGFSIGWMNNLLWDPQRAITQFSCAYTTPFYCDEDLMPLIEAARVEMDPVKREQLLKDIMKGLVDSGAALWLTDFSGSAAYAANIEVGDFRIDGTLFEAMTMTRN